MFAATTGPGVVSPSKTNWVVNKFGLTQKWKWTSSNQLVTNSWNHTLIITPRLRAITQSPHTAVGHWSWITNFQTKFYWVLLVNNDNISILRTDFLSYVKLLADIQKDRLFQSARSFKQSSVATEHTVSQSSNFFCKYYANSPVLNACQLQPDCQS